MENSDLFIALNNISGVSEINEEKLKFTDSSNYFSFGTFKYSSIEDDERPYKIIYGTFRKPNSLCIGLSISFVFEDFEKKLLTLELLEIIDEYNKFAIGIKAHSLEQEKDDELNISLNTEFYLPSNSNGISDESTEIILINLRFLENAPTSFSEYLKAKGVPHNYLVEN
ncbi:hypothetical protein [Serratia marcescens]|uniref:hypothetical protein n=1 Tax=Serratia marcescens TaxID=615 RepID=UPI0015926228|nr:hypothetical protein [Serratia marcescens]